jgi:opine dehydrogenase
MSTLAVLGAGNGGCAAVAELAPAGHEVRLWNRSEAALAPLRAAGGVRYEGALGSGLARIAVLTTDLPEALAGAEAALVCLPAVAHAHLAAELARTGPRLPVVLNPGHTCGALHLERALRSAGAMPPPIAELSTLTYVARKPAPDAVRVTARAGRVRAACLPGGEEALRLARELYPHAMPQPDVLATGLANVNMVLHPPGAILGAAWIEATGGRFRFYSEGTTPGVARVIEALDAERLAVARAFGHELSPLVAEMAAIGTADPDAAAAGDLHGAIARGEANRELMAPDGLGHRYYREDLGFGLVPLEALAGVAGVRVPVTSALLEIGAALTGSNPRAEGLDADALGFDGLGVAELLRRVRPSRTARQVASR